MRGRQYKVRLKLAEPLGALGDLLGRQATDPVFMIGTGRCGSSLLTRVLNSHPEIVCFPNEANHLWHPRLYPYSQRTIDAESIEVDPRRFTEISVANWPVGHAKKILRTFKGFHISAGLNRVLVVKSAMISFMVPQIVSLFPDARFIHIYRYGPSVVRSAFKKNAGDVPMDPQTEERMHESWADYWNACITEIDRARDAYNLDSRQAYFECSYEALCQAPEPVLEELAKYLGVESHRFTYDLDSIDDRNYKATKEPEAPWLTRMHTDSDRYPAMQSKGYLDGG